MSQGNAFKLKPAFLVEAEKLRKNEGQWAAYESKQHCVLLAGPGSGKTKTLSVKLARMIAEDIRGPQGIACITYNKECVRELRKRLGHLGVSESRRVVISTVHSFCLQHVVRPFSNLAGMQVPSPLRVALEQEQEKTFAQALATAVSRDEDATRWRQRCDIHRRKEVDRTQDSWYQDEDAARTIEKYESILYEQGLIDFDGMILAGLELIKTHEWVRKALKARFPILVVDEYQDLGHPLHHIVLNQCFTGGTRLFAVGDPDQSIYGFTGAAPELLEELAARDGVEKIHLKLNYRCGPTIIKASSAALNVERKYESASGNVGTVDVHVCPGGLEEQIEFVCETIIPAALSRREGRRRGDIAILYRDRHDGECVSKEVERRGWDFIRVDRGNPYPRTPLIFWLEDCASWCAGGWKSGEPALSDLVRTWLSFNQSISTEFGRRQVRISLVRFLYQWREKDVLVHEWLTDMRAKVLEPAFTLDELLRDHEAAVAELEKVTAEDGRLSAFTVSTFGGQAGTSNHLNLMTLHSAKGQEFDVVVMVGLEQGRTPGFRSIAARDQGRDGLFKEDRRLFYVGLTRARHEVHLLHSGWYQNQYGRTFKNGKSQFIEEVEQAISKK